MLTTSRELSKIPKIELHAHLNGCARVSHIKDLVDNPNDLPTPPPTNASPQHYFEYMGAISRITNHPKSLRFVLNKILEDFEADGVVYLELRSSPKHTVHMTKVEYIETIIDCMAKYPGKMIVRHLVSIDQSKSKTEMLENADLAIKYTHSSPYVCGVDLCGDFITANNLDSSVAALLRCKEAGLKIACHIAEDPVIADHTHDLLRLILPDRLGHATLIDPDSADGLFVRENNMLIECCMTSNVLCKSVESYGKHHFKEWNDRQHPVLLCTDDSGTFNTTLTEEYAMAMKTFNLEVEDLMKMNRRAVGWVFDDSVKDTLRKIFL